VKLSAGRVDLGGASKLVARETDTTTGPSIVFAQAGPAVTITITNPGQPPVVVTLGSPAGLTVAVVPPGAITLASVIDAPGQSKVYA
jgi:hypothetical protein